MAHCYGHGVPKGQTRRKTGAQSLEPTPAPTGRAVRLPKEVVHVSRAGFTLIEVMIAAVIMAGAVLGLASLIPTITLQTEVARESNVAMATANQMAESIRQYADDAWLYVWRAYNADPADDPNGNGTAPGNAFPVTGLYGQYGGAQVGTITFHIDETADEPRVGLPGKDLDGDGLFTSTDVSANYALLPFTISIDWKGRTGMMRHAEVSSQVVDY